MVTTRSINAAPALQENNAPSLEETVEQGRPKKQRKTKQTTSVPKTTIPRRGLRGKLSGLMHMPVDIFAEVTSHLQPLDLIRLARTSNHLRSILMSKSARSLWVASRRNVPGFPDAGFPECPREVPEPCYASLVFEKGCMQCERNVTCDIFLGDRLRICERCQSDFMLRAMVDEVDFINLCELPPSMTMTEACRIFAIIPTCMGGCFVPATAQRVYEECMVQKARLSDNDYIKYLQERGEAAPALIGSDLALAIWLDAYSGDQNRQKEDAKKDREEAIREKLLEKGWLITDFPDPLEDDPEDLKAWRKIANQTKPLTERIWNNQQANLEDILHTIKRKRQRILQMRNRIKEILGFYQDFVAAEATEETLGMFPSRFNIHHMPWIFGLLEEIGRNPELPITLALWNNIVEDLRHEIRIHQRSIRNMLASLARAELVDLAHAMGTMRPWDWSPVDIEDEDANAAFLDRDLLRMTFGFPDYEGEEMYTPYPEALKRGMEYAQTENLDEDMAYMYPFIPDFMECKIEHPDRFELVDGIWT